jgi:hypothetical protein
MTRRPAGEQRVAVQYRYDATGDNRLANDAQAKLRTAVDSSSKTSNTV